MKHKHLFFLLAVLMSMAVGVTMTSCGDDEENYDDLGNAVFVDLDLPSGTLWATHNIGASKPEEYGNYYAWGETVTKSSYTESNYSSYSKYNKSGVNILSLEDDAAYMNWGPNWRMPSVEQFEELLNSNYTTTMMVSVQGINGLLVSSKRNGKRLFFPAAGTRQDGTGNPVPLQGRGEVGQYWSRTRLNGDYDWCCPSRLYFLVTSSAYLDYYGPRYRGLSIRPVYVP